MLETQQPCSLWKTLAQLCRQHCSCGYWVLQVRVFDAVIMETYQGTFLPMFYQPIILSSLLAQIPI
jgi:hypothetical protein